MSSTRLPGKVLRPLAGAPMIVRQIERLRRAKRIDTLVVATSTERSDDVLAEICSNAPVAVFRGELEDVLARYVGALDAFGEDAQHVVRLTADCPLCDPGLIDAVIEQHLNTGADYTANTWGKRTFPKGLDADIVKADPTADAHEFHRVVQAARCPVLVRGGGRENLQQVFERSRVLLDQGAVGMVYGRNVYQHANPAAVVAALMAMIHDGASAQAAWQLYESR